MRRQRYSGSRKKPGIMLSPMIDMIFLLLVFFIVSSLNMSEIKTIPIKLPVAENSQIVNRNTANVTVKKDGTIYLEDQQTNLQELVRIVRAETKNDPNYAILIRGEANADYKLVVKLIDDLKGAGVYRFGLVTDIGEGNE